jgi:uncharacterized delta-60 repeat protein
MGAMDDRAYAVPIQSDGKIVAAGYSNNGSKKDFALARYNTDGSLDSGFGGGSGHVTTMIGAGDDVAYAIAIQTSDGRIVAVGYSFNGANNDFAIVRYNADGTLDTQLNGNGKLTTDFGSSDGRAYGVAVQNDGKLITAGSSVFSMSQFATARYDPSGTLDAIYNGVGMTTASVGTGDSAGMALAIQPSDGKIVVGGYAYNGANGVFALLRYNTDGTPDSTFNNSGIVTASIGPGSAFGAAIAIQPSDGKIVAVGYSSDGSRNVFAAVRFTTTGALDTSFGAGGVTTIGVGTGSDDRAYALAIQPSDGKLVLAGTSTTSSGSSVAVVRLMP